MLLIFRAEGRTKICGWRGGVVGESKIKKNSARSISKKSNDFVGKFMLEWKAKPAAGGKFYGLRTPNQCKKHVFSSVYIIIPQKKSALPAGENGARFAYVRFFFVFEISGGGGVDLRTKMSTVCALIPEKPPLPCGCYRASVFFNPIG